MGAIGYTVYFIEASASLSEQFWYLGYVPETQIVACYVYGRSVCFIAFGGFCARSDPAPVFSFDVNVNVDVSLFVDIGGFCNDFSKTNNFQFGWFGKFFMAPCVPYRLLMFGNGQFRYRMGFYSGCFWDCIALIYWAFLST